MCLCCANFQGTMQICKMGCAVMAFTRKEQQANNNGNAYRMCEQHTYTQCLIMYLTAVWNIFFPLSVLSLLTSRLKQRLSFRPYLPVSTYYAETSTCHLPNERACVYTHTRMCACAFGSKSAGDRVCPWSVDYPLASGSKLIGAAPLRHWSYNDHWSTEAALAWATHHCRSTYF